MLCDVILKFLTFGHIDTMRSSALKASFWRSSRVIVTEYKLEDRARSPRTNTRSCRGVEATLKQQFG